MKRSNFCLILCLVFGLLGSAQAQSLEPSPAEPGLGRDLLATDFFSLDLHTQLAGFWGSIPYVTAQHLGPILVAPWSMTASGNSWQIWSQASAVWLFRNGEQPGRLRTQSANLGLDRSFQDRWLLGLALNAGQYQFEPSADYTLIKDVFWGGKVYSALRLPYALELSGFFGLAAYEGGVAFSRAQIWHGGLGLGRSFLIQPGLTLRPSLDWEVFSTGKNVAGYGQPGSFRQHRFRLGLQVSKYARRAVLRGQVGVELWTTNADHRAGQELDKDPQAFLNCRIDAAWQLGRHTDFGLSYQGRFGAVSQAHGITFNIGLIF